MKINLISLWLRSKSRGEHLGFELWMPQPVVVTGHGRISQGNEVSWDLSTHPTPSHPSPCSSAFGKVPLLKGLAFKTLSLGYRALGFSPIYSLFTRSVTSDMPLKFSKSPLVSAKWENNNCFLHLRDGCH